MKKFLIATAALVAMSLLAAAADLRMTVKAPAMAAAYSWAGIVYRPVSPAMAGVIAKSSYAAIDTILFCAGPDISATCRDHCLPDNSGFVGGLQAGYNWQSGAGRFRH